MPQNFPVDPSLPVTVEDFLALTGSGGRSASASGGDTAAHRRAARRVGLRGLERRPLSVLSGGELRRVLLAHALDPIPELLILDEPAAGLDEGACASSKICCTLKDGGTTVLMVSHDLDQVRRIADRVTVLDRAGRREGRRRRLALDECGAVALGSAP